MTKTALQVGYLAICLFGPATFTTINGASTPSKVTDDAQGHSSGLIAKVTLHDGGVRTMRLDGVGCNKAICSRTAIKGIAPDSSERRAWFDSLAAIRTTSDREALLIWKDGSSQRISLLTDFRVLYLATRLGAVQRLDLASVKSVEFPGKKK